MTAPLQKSPIARFPTPTEPVHVCLHLPRQMAATAIIALIDGLAARLDGAWEYRHPLGAQIGVYHIHVQERQP